MKTTGLTTLELIFNYHKYENSSSCENCLQAIWHENKPDVNNGSYDENAKLHGYKVYYVIADKYVLSI